MTKTRTRAVFLGVAIALSSVAGVASPAHAIDGFPDPRFSADGYQTTSLSAGDDVANAVVIQPDGKTVAVGYASTGNTDFAIVRYNLNGSPDATFSGDGKVTTPIGSSDDVAVAVVIQSDGKIVVAGISNNGANDDFAVARYSSTGTLDPTFSGDGKVVTSIGAGNDIVTSVALAPSGKIVVGGYSSNGLNDDMAVVRYNTNGTLDTTFSGDGKQTTASKLGADPDQAAAVAVQPDGKIVLAGYSHVGLDRPTIARLNPNGTFDSTFNLGTGIASLTLSGNAPGRASAAVAMPDGRMVLVGYGSTSGTDAIFVAYFLANGGSATRFPLTDIVDDHPVAATLQPYGDGQDVIFATQSGRVVRYNTQYLSGDGSFGSDGAAYTSDFTGVTSVAAARDGAIAVAGFTHGATDDFEVGRLLGDGTIPWTAHMIGVPRYSLSSSRNVSWSASDTGTGVKNYDVREQAAPYTTGTFGGFSPLYTATTNPTGTFTGTPGHTYCLSARGRDFAGNVGEYSTRACVAIPLDERALAVHGAWTARSNSVYYRATAMDSTAAGAYLSITGAYRHLAVVVTTCSGCGTLQVFRGPTLVGAINLDSASTVHGRVVEVPASATLVSGALKLRQASAGKRVIVEGLAISAA